MMYRRVLVCAFLCKFLGVIFVYAASTGAARVGTPEREVVQYEVSPRPAAQVELTTGVLKV